MSDEKMNRNYPKDIMSNFEWSKKIAERLRGYTITPQDGGDYKVVWVEDGERFEDFLTEENIIELVDSWAKEK